MKSYYLFLIFILCCVQSSYEYGMYGSEWNYHHSSGTHFEYKFYVKPRNFEEAKKTCENDNATLFFPENEYEAKSLVMVYMLIAPDGYEFKGSILGLKRSGNSFINIDTGLPTRFNEWKSGGPEFDKGACVFMGHKENDAFLESIPCYEERQFICQRPYLIYDPTKKNMPEPEEEDPISIERGGTNYPFIPGTHYYYKLHKKRATFEDAKKICEAEQATIFYPETEYEAKVVGAFWERSPSYFPQGAFAGVKRSGNDFKTIDTGISIEKLYSNWRAGEPNNADGVEDCVGFSYAAELLWMNDIPCSSKQSFICKVPITTSFPTAPQTSIEIDDDNYHYIPGTVYFYKLHYTEATVEVAKQTCESENATLFYALDDHEAKTVVSFWKTNRKGGFPQGSVLGIKRDGNDFKTFETNISISILFNTWKEGEPNNAYGAENCVSILHSGDDVLLNDIPCYKKGLFICKTPFNLINTNKTKDVYKAYHTIQGTNNKYKLHRTPVSFFTANATCIAENATLFYAESEQEAKTVMGYWKTLPDGAVPNGIVLGLRRTGEDFQAIDTGKSIKNYFHHWGYREPNNANNVENCVSMTQTDDGNCWLNDVPCPTEAMFICKISSQSSNKRKPGDDGYHPINGTKYSYKLHDTPTLFEHANTTCNSEGASLFYAETEEEANAVMADLIRLRNGNAPDEVILGLTRKGNDFVSLDTNTSVSKLFNKWARGEPNNANNNERCVVMSYKDGKILMNDVKCWQAETPFMCRLRPEPKASNDEPSNGPDSNDNGEANDDQTNENTELCNVPNRDYGYTRFGRRFYKLHSTPETWDDARKKCQDEGTDLAVLNSDEEAAFVVTLLNTRPKTRIPGRFLRRAIFLGFQLNDDEKWETVEGDWLADSGYDNWGPGQPDGDQRAYCGSMFFNGELNDVGCNKKALFLCESLSCS